MIAHAARRTAAGKGPSRERFSSLPKSSPRPRVAATPARPVSPVPASPAPEGPAPRPADGARSFLMRLCSAPLLTPDEEYDCFSQLRDAEAQTAAYEAEGFRHLARAARTEAEAVRDRLVRSNVRLVVSIVKRYAPDRQRFEELLSEGLFTLLRSVEKFDHRRGFRLSTYVTHAVTRTVYRATRLRQTERERFVSWEEGELEDAAVGRTSAYSEQRYAELRGALGRLLDRLDDRERRIVRARFALDEREDAQTLQSLADELGVCKERVRQIEKRALAKLQHLAQAEAKTKAPRGAAPAAVEALAG